MAQDTKSILFNRVNFIVEKMIHLLKYIKIITDILITMTIWIYFIFGYLIFFSPFHAMAFLFYNDRETAFQYLNHIYFKSFFALIRIITPGIKFDIDKNIYSIQEAVIICNHLSYLDPIFLVSLFKKQKTIVKSIFFRLPVFGWLLKTSGYIPSSTGKNLTEMMIKNIENIQEYIASGGVIFIFPEGTRNRKREISSFGKGAFSIAKQSNAQIKVLFISNTDKLFQPGKFLFNTCVKNMIKVELLATIEPDYRSEDFSVSGLMNEVRRILEIRNDETRHKEV